VKASDRETYPALFRPSKGYVFVVTYGRSGSTLTQALLNSLPGYCVRGENANLTHYIARIADIVVTEENFVDRRDNIIKPLDARLPHLQPILGNAMDPWFGAELPDPDDLRLSLFDLFAEKVLQVPEGCRVCGFKEIRQWMHPDFFAPHLDILHQSFPNTRFLFQTRNWQDVSRSKWWRQIPPDRVRDQIATADALFADYQAAHPECCFTIAFERYAEGVPYIREILDFLGEDLPDERIEAILSRRLAH
jgi:hypothetical protein